MSAFMVGPGCIGCGGIATFKKINTQIIYHIDNIPFKTKNKIEHYKCTLCGETYLPPNMAHILQKEMLVGQKFLAEQDKMYSVPTITPHDIIKCESCDKFNNLHNTKKGYCQYCHVSLPMFMDTRYYELPASAKQWFHGYIKYMANVEWSKHPALQTEQFIIYSDESSVSGIAMKQFTLPSNGTKIVGVKYASL